MPNIPRVASEIFDVMRSFGYQLKLYDDKTNVVLEPEEATRFFGGSAKTKKENIIVAVRDDNDNSTIKLIKGPTTDMKKIEGFWETLRTLAGKYNMTWELETGEKDIQPKDYFTNAAIAEGFEQMINESLYGTSRSSYWMLESAKLICRHKAPVQEGKRGARLKESNIRAIYVENAQQERHLLPHTNVYAGMATAQHVNQGGSTMDAVATQINQMAGFYGDLGQTVAHLGDAAMVAESAGEMREKCKTCRRGLRETFAKLASPRSYAAEAARLAEAGEPPLLEGSELEALRESLTVEGRELPENVLMACARVLAQEGAALQSNMLAEEEPVEEQPVDDEADLDADAAPEEEEEGPARIEILGRDISSEAWELIKNGEIDIKGAPDLRDLPRFTSTLSQIMYKMNLVAQKANNHEVANFLGQIYDDYASDKYEKDPVARREATMLGIKVCRAAGVEIQVNEGRSPLGPRGVNAILEFEAWFDQFDPTRVLFETSQGVNPSMEDDIQDQEGGSGEVVRPREQEPDEDAQLEEGDLEIGEDIIISKDENVEESLEDGEDETEDKRENPWDVKTESHMGMDLAAEVQSEDDGGQDAAAATVGAQIVRLAERLRGVREGQDKGPREGTSLAVNSEWREENREMAKKFNGATVARVISGSGDTWVVETSPIRPAMTVKKVRVKKVKGDWEIIGLA